MSRPIITELLRGELKYEGVVVTDDLGMKAICKDHSLADAVAGSLTAGVDLMLMCDATEEQRVEAFEVLTSLQDSDPYLQRLVATSAARIANLKSRIPQGPVDVEAAAAIVGSAENRALAEP